MTIAAPLHQLVDLSKARRGFIFGDVHGRLDLLLEAMERVGFDADAGDWLIGVGDWLDRGPATTEIADFIENQKNLIFTRGNHEQLLWGATHPTFFPSHAIIPNGGHWIVDHIDTKRDTGDKSRTFLDKEGTRIQNIVNECPIALTITTPGGRTIGVVHADVPGTNWTEFTNYLDTATRNEMGGEETIQNKAIWSRKTINEIEKAATFNALDGYDCTVTGIDHVFHGHTVVNEAFSHCNRSWIDTGAYESDRLTFVEIDEWLNSYRP